ncbi:SgcJ/EcaC family oxidoreductase [Luteolibacter sp. GHJ8]|uniref:SgcJ/EcaC family oxidoreductase n=1 Tax=Luteolibacter rhizosphaerae TaxID=2989719 RepID=A0ABT3G0M9_9BACT|nr:SgcJ/EcaC family oxidoreductase [Luteolibacter rhizosphaerae]MCW1913391.1 SgcJ/EcaC family oxidoreductase [Luteolibacter rhizosphaerae]
MNSNSTDEQLIRNLIQTWIDASAAGNLETVLDLMTEDAVFLLPGQPPLRGRPAFAARSQGNSGLGISGTAEIQEIEIHGDFAWCWNQLRLSITPEDASTIYRSGPVFTVFRREGDGRWRLHRDANLLTVEPVDS